MQILKRLAYLRATDWAFVYVFVFEQPCAGISLSS